MKDEFPPNQLVNSRQLKKNTGWEDGKTSFIFEMPSFQVSAVDFKVNIQLLLLWIQKFGECKQASSIDLVITYSPKDAWDWYIYLNLVNLYGEM